MENQWEPPENLGEVNGKPRGNQGEVKVKIRGSQGKTKGSHTGEANEKTKGKRINSI